MTDPVTPQLTAEHIDREIVRVISVMEHLPGIRQSRDIEAYVARACKSTGESPERVREKIKVLVGEKSHIAATTRPDIVALARSRAMPLMSHDDTDIAHIEEGVAEGVSISEFPCSIEAAVAARKAAGMQIVAGAPNLVRGGLAIWQYRRAGPPGGKADRYPCLGLCAAFDARRSLHDRGRSGSRL